MSGSSALRRAATAPLFDKDALARAEDALRGMSAHFQGWLEEELAKIQEARLAAEAEGWSDAALTRVLSTAHDVKGLGATYDYPLATRIAGSLCRLLDTPEGMQAARRAPALVTAHIDAMRAAARERIQTSDHPVGRALLRELETRVDALCLPAR